jgi:hypothetical protein
MAEVELTEQYNQKKLHNTIRPDYHWKNCHIQLNT